MGGEVEAQTLNGEIDWALASQLEQEGAAIGASPTKRTRPAAGKRPRSLADVDDKAVRKQALSLRCISILTAVIPILMAVAILFQPFLPGVKPENILALTTRFMIFIGLGVPSIGGLAAMWYFAPSLGAHLIRARERRNTVDWYEQNIRALGGFKCVTGVFYLVVSIYSGISTDDDQSPVWFGISFGVLTILEGLGLRRFMLWAWWFSFLGYLFGLLLFPIGTVVCGAFLAILIASRHLFAR